MVEKQNHILNGDALHNIFPTDIEGKTYITRECLLEGNVNSETLVSFFQKRAEFISNTYEGFSKDDYFDMSVLEFNKIQNIPENEEINLWFEHDLFCQVNFWFIVKLLSEHMKTNKIYFVQPLEKYKYNFTAMSKGLLKTALNERLKIEDNELSLISKLWDMYQTNNIKSMLEIGRDLQDKFPFILAAIVVHLERIPRDDYLGRPSMSLLTIIDELKTNDFKTIFQEFSKREAIYGFGDLQVKQLLKNLLKRSD